MTIDEQIIEYANETIEKYGIGKIILLCEIYYSLFNKYGTKEGSIIPSDYCYNRINNGIQLSKPTVFEFLGNGKYKCLGLNYPYNGVVFHKPKSSVEIPVGKCINGERVIAIENKHFSNELEKNLEKKDESIHLTNRIPSLKLRFEVLRRDNFKCCICGASPAKDPSIELHIDHIIPWSKGGETTFDNLRTLCSKCNLGKGGTTE